MSIHSTYMEVMIMDSDKKKISIYVPRVLLKRMAKHREEEGRSVSFQLCKGAEQYLDEQEKV